MYPGRFCGRFWSTFPSEGLLEAASSGGYAPRHFTLEDIRDAILARSALEGGGRACGQTNPGSFGIGTGTKAERRNGGVGRIRRATHADARKRCRGSVT